ncbi:MAG TPA: hypothetical protein VF919_03370 [Gemmatimonadales bacterium]
MRSGTDDLIPFLKALILLQLAGLREREDLKPELLLHRAGLGITEIAEMLNKTYAAAAKTVSRAKREEKKGE